MKNKLFIVAILLFVLTLTLSCSKEVNRIGILSALPQELDGIEAKTLEKKIVKLGEDKFIIGKIGNVPIVATLSGMGKVNAAIAAQRLISNFNASAILFTGVAGGLSQTVEIGDVVLGLKIFQHDVGFLGDAFVRHAPGILPEIGIGKDGPTIDKDMMKAWPQINDKDIVATILEYEKGKPFSFEKVVVGGQAYAPKLKAGIVTTGDQFIAQEAKKEELRSLGADLVEMEGGAVAQVAERNNVPCLIIRSVSDKAGAHAQMDFEKFFSVVAKNNILIVADLLNNEKYAGYFNALLK
jgi:adenosylhomocysteine nucleosidase